MVKDHGTILLPTNMDNLYTIDIYKTNVALNNAKTCVINIVQLLMQAT